MVRTDYDISDEEFSKLMEPFENAIREYIVNNFIYDYLAFYISTGYNMDALWDGDLRSHINAAFDSICDTEYKCNLDYSKIKKILKDKYGLVIKKDKRPFEIVDIKKEDQRSS